MERLKCCKGEKLNSWNEGGDCNNSYTGDKQKPGTVCLVMLQKLRKRKF